MVSYSPKFQPGAGRRDGYGHFGRVPTRASPVRRKNERCSMVDAGDRRRTPKSTRSASYESLVYRPSDDLTDASTVVRTRPDTRRFATFNSNGSTVRHRHCRGVMEAAERRHRLQPRPRAGRRSLELLHALRQLQQPGTSEGRGGWLHHNPALLLSPAVAVAVAVAAAVVVVAAVGNATAAVQIGERSSPRHRRQCSTAN